MLCVPLPLLFFIAWTVIGFVMCSDMNSDTICAKMVLAWSAIEMGEVLVGCCLLCALCYG